MNVVKKKCAFLTMDSLENFYAYDELAVEPLSHVGWEVDHISWRRADVCWDDYDLVVIRSPWDYQSAPGRFLGVLRQIDRSRARLENNLRVVNWNINKTYLRDLETRGVTIVPTAWPSSLNRQSIHRAFTGFGVDQMVVKPTVGANADDAFWLHNDASDAEYDAVVKVFTGRPTMVQPFIDSIRDPGEYSLFYFGSVYSHSILKSPKAGDFRVQEEHGSSIRAAQPPSDLLDAGHRAIAAIEEPTLYARVDLVRLADGRPAVMELELIEPSLYFSFDADSPWRFAQALDNLFS